MPTRTLRHHGLKTHLKRQVELDASVPIAALDLSLLQPLHPVGLEPLDPLAAHSAARASRKKRRGDPAIPRTQTRGGQSRQRQAVQSDPRGRTPTVRYRPDLPAQAVLRPAGTAYEWSRWDRNIDGADVPFYPRSGATCPPCPWGAHDKRIRSPHGPLMDLGGSMHRPSLDRSVSRGG